MPEASEITSRKRIPRTSNVGGKGQVPVIETWGTNVDYRTDDYTQSTETLRQCYKRTAAVRWSVDTVARELSTMPWTIAPNYVGAIKPRTVKHTLELVHFFNDPNVNAESFADLLSQVVTDILVLDRGVIEKVSDIAGDLSELWARDGATFHPRRDMHGVITSYVQKLGTKKSIPFDPDEIVFFKMIPTSYSKYGMPIIESIINEIGAVLFSIDWVAKSFTEDEIPPGILSLGEIGEVAYERAKSEFQEKKGIYGKGNIRVIDNVKDVKWTELKNSNSEMQLLELSERLDRTIYRNFGIEYELISSEATGFSLADKVKKIRLLKPLARKIAWKINNEILPSFGYDDVRFQFVIRDTEGDATRASASKTYLITGQRSINEEREQDGYLPIPGGDRRFIMVGKRLIFLDDMANMNSEAIEQTKGGAKEGTTEQKTEQQQSGNEDRSKRQEQPTESTKE